jgi:hypothetical protein
LLTYRPKRKQTIFPSPLAVTRPVVDSAASLDNSKKTTLSSKSTKPRPVATPSAAEDNYKDKDFAPPKKIPIHAPSLQLKTFLSINVGMKLWKTYLQ